ncbi:MAG: hypothetical protein LQ347_000369 [Umbilicaria vellea]|nr:MAG: hypothetical protein LQ347_000369 [Umbilicaria vellea]
MSEDKVLMARISQLAGELSCASCIDHFAKVIQGHINLHKTQKPSEQVSSYDTSQPLSRLSRGPGRGAQTRRIPREFPYNRGRAGRVMPQGHRNRTLVLSGTTGRATGSDDTTVNKSDEENSGQYMEQKSGWITKRDRHMQLINSSVFDKESQARSKAIEETRRQKAQQRDQREKLKIKNHLQFLNAAEQPAASLSTTPNFMLHKLVINGVQFQVVDGGSKLLRVAGKTIRDTGNTPRLRLNSEFLDAATAARSTPKHAKIGGVTFLRSRNGNLYRSGIVKTRK